MSVVKNLVLLLPGLIPALVYEPGSLSLSLSQQRLGFLLGFLLWNCPPTGMYSTT